MSSCSNQRTWIFKFYKNWVFSFIKIKNFDFYHKLSLWFLSQGGGSAEVETKTSCSLEKLSLGTFHGQQLVVASIADSCQAGIGLGNHDGQLWRRINLHPWLLVAKLIFYFKAMTVGCHDWQLLWLQKFASATMNACCQAEIGLGNHDWRFPSRNLPWQPWLMVAKQKFTLATMTDGCQAEIGLGNHDWRLPSRNLPWQPWLTVSKQKLGLATMTDGCQGEICLGNYDWRLPGRNWAWQPWLMVAKQKFA